MDKKEEWSTPRLEQIELGNTKGGVFEGYVEATKGPTYKSS